MVLAVWLLPLASFLSLVAAGRRLGHRSGVVSSVLTGLTLPGVVALLATTPAGTTRLAAWPWLGILGHGLSLGWLVDPLSVMMAGVVALVSTLVQVYSLAYMKGDRDFPVFFAEISLFTFAMQGLVFAPDLLQLFIFWELVGLCSYLLIGFWHTRPAAARSATKAFVVTRTGDLGLLAGILLLWSATGTLNIPRLLALAGSGALGGWVLTGSALLVFAGAVGKSAQFPLHTWLPDAMEGPTPISALIHAATMVAAGVYLVARMYPLFAASPTALEVVASIGALTALLAAGMGLVENELKRVVAYSTMSQLGYMMLGLGTGAYTAGLFQLFNHAFFKSLLFLAAGSVIHAADTHDLRRMGGLARRLPLSAPAFLAGALALGGIPPFSGFFSKDPIIAATAHQPALYAAALAGALLTSLYIFRAYFLVFAGTPRGEHPGGEGSSAMRGPLWILTVLSLGSGLAYHFFHRYLGRHPAAPYPVWSGSTWITLAVSGTGILLAWLLFANRPVERPRLAAPAHRLLAERFYLDQLYAGTIVRPILALSRAASWLDRRAVDGLVNGLARMVMSFGRGLRRVEVGRAQSYALAAFWGLALFILLLEGVR